MMWPANSREAGHTSADLLPASVERGDVPARTPLHPRLSRLGIAAAVVILVAGQGLSVRAQGDEDLPSAADAACQADTKGARVEMAADGYGVSADSLALEIGDLVFNGNFGQRAASTPRGSSERVLETRWFEHDLEQGLQFVFASDGSEWRVVEILAKDTADDSSWIAFTDTGLENPVGVELAQDVFTVASTEPVDARLSMCGLRVFVEADTPSVVTPEVAYAAIEGETDPVAVHEALTELGLRVSYRSMRPGGADEVSNRPPDGVVATELTKFDADGQAVVFVQAPPANPCPGVRHEKQDLGSRTGGRDSMVAVAVMTIDCAWGGKKRPTIAAVRQEAGISDDEHLSLEGVVVAADGLAEVDGRPIDVRRRTARPLDELWRHLVSEQPVGLLINYDIVADRQPDRHQLGSDAPGIHAVWVRFGREDAEGDRFVLVHDPLANRGLLWDWGTLRAAARGYRGNDAWSGVVLFDAPTSDG